VGFRGKVSTLQIRKYFRFGRFILINGLFHLFGVIFLGRPEHKGGGTSSGNYVPIEIGKLFVKEKSERGGRNPATGDGLHLRPLMVVTFIECFCTPTPAYQ